MKAKKIMCLAMVAILSLSSLAVADCNLGDGTLVICQTKCNTF